VPADRARSRLEGERGSSAVEFALLLPILLLVLLALVQVGVLARDSLVLTQASRAGAREAAVQPSPDAVEQAVRGAAAGWRRNA
jgi:Flp pilus assembly protein TadG